MINNKTPKPKLYHAWIMWRIPNTKKNYDRVINFTKKYFQEKKIPDGKKNRKNLQNFGKHLKLSERKNKNKDFLCSLSISANPKKQHISYNIYRLDKDYIKRFEKFVKSIPGTIVYKRFWWFLLKLPSSYEVNKRSISENYSKQDYDTQHYKKPKINRKHGKLMFSQNEIQFLHYDSILEFKKDMQYALNLVARNKIRISG
jgi:hypothetical protein